MISLIPFFVVTDLSSAHDAFAPQLIILRSTQQLTINQLFQHKFNVVVFGGEDGWKGIELFLKRVRAS